jgi:hypothetical protein
MPTKPDFDVWDSCCLFGVLNNEQDKVHALLAQMPRFEAGDSILGIPTAVIAEVVALADGSPADMPLKKFLANPYIQILTTTVEVAFLSSKLQMRFDSRRMPELRTKAMAAGCPSDQALRLRSRDSEILSAAMHYKANRLTTYDPFLRFLGLEYIAPETGLVIDVPQTSFLSFQFPQKSAELSVLPRAGRKFRDSGS